jgi:hypothetical protein
VSYLRHGVCSQHGVAQRYREMTPGAIDISLSPNMQKGLVLPPALFSNFEAFRGDCGHNWPQSQASYFLPVRQPSA